MSKKVEPIQIVVESGHYVAFRNLRDKYYRELEARDEDEDDNYCLNVGSMLDCSRRADKELGLNAGF